MRKFIPESLVKFFIYVGLLIELTMFNACTRAVDPIQSQQLVSPFFVNTDVARRAAENVDRLVLNTSSRITTQSLGGASTSTSKNMIGIPEGQSPKEIIAYPSVIEPSLYIVNYEKGWVILSTDRRIEPILAYSDQGQFRLEQNMPAGITNWLQLVHQNTQVLRKDSLATAPVGTISRWNRLLNGSSTSPVATTNFISDSVHTNVVQPPDPPCQDYGSVETHGPFINVQWGQLCSYNDLCPTGVYCGNHGAVGCIATAFGQVTTKYQTPSNFNWSSMSNGASGGNNAVQSLLRQIGVYIDMLYTTNNESYPLGSDQDVANKFKQTMSYSSTDAGAYNYSSVYDNIANHQWPVILQGWTGQNHSGYGHAFVCDGTQTTQNFYCDCGCTITVPYLHINWGWNEIGFNGNNNNGWYYYQSWAPSNTGPGSNYNFQYAQTMWYNIHP